MDIRSLLQKLFRWMTIRPTSETTDGNNDFTGGLCMSEEKTIRLNFGDKECLISPYEHPVSPEVLRHYKKLELSGAQQKQMSEFAEQMSATMENAGANQSYYVLRCPDGLPNILTPFTDGSDAMSAFVKTGGKIAVQASVVYSLIRIGFSLLALIEQFFLRGIHNKLNVINRKIDEILEFLYGDKKAELLSAISFTRYAYENFSSIMEHEGQRNATIQSLQSARMTAMQDVEFYLSDLHFTVSVDKNKRFPDQVSEIERIVRKSIDQSSCLDLSLQLCMTTHLLEIYYSQNYDPKYLGYVENDVGDYISRCEKQMIGDFSSLKTSLDFQWSRKRGREQEQVGKLCEQVQQKLDSLSNDKSDELKAKLAKALHSLQKETECCIGTDGNVYLKTED